LLRPNLIKFLLFISTIIFTCNLFAINSIKATRVWPAPDYTRITIESNSKINNDQMMLQNPERIVIDLKEIQLNSALKQLTSQVKSNDPNIKKIRIGQFNKRVTRVVIDLKNSARVKIFSLSPIAPYQHRLVIDVYPNEKDSIAILLKKIEEMKKPVTEVENIVQKKQKKEVLINKKPEIKKIIIAIDPGHGGEDPGAIGKRGTKEKDINMRISKKLKNLIDKQKNMKAVLIRDKDYYVPLKGRVSKARKYEADIFVSIHADAFNKRSVSGSSVFALSEKGASSAFAKFLANKENEADLIGGVSIDDKEPVLARTLLDLSQSATINDSLKLGNFVLREIKKVNNLHKKRVEQAGFAVLKAPDIPSILVETAFLSNPQEERNLNSNKFQNKIAKAIFKGIKGYINSGVNFKKN
jgi:N-acetylmuramoyl-L-alanine amidase